MKILIYGQRLQADQVAYVETLIAECNTRGWSIAIYQPYAEKIKALGMDTTFFIPVQEGKDLDQLSIDYVMSLGGDGTILNAITLIAHRGIPVVGINLGRLGFLASIEKSKISEIIEDIAHDNITVAERSLLALECNHDIFGKTKFALNDFTITKRDDSSMVKIKTFVDGKLLNVYWADGLIVATPTGSTGYSLSCGGPIVFPQSENFVITPIAPHNLNVRPVVLSDTSIISFDIEGRAEHFLSTLDSRYEKITANHQITIKKCDFTVKLVKPQGITFMDTISSKLMWGLDMRN